MNNYWIARDEEHVCDWCNEEFTCYDDESYPCEHNGKDFTCKPCIYAEMQVADEDERERNLHNGDDDYEFVPRDTDIWNHAYGE